jgi:hypothetical protein
VLFNAADLNGDGSLQYEECALLFRHISELKYSKDKYKLLFKQNSDLIVIDGDESQRAISFDSFAKLALSNKIFT